jgi:hypothetical protein
MRIPSASAPTEGDDGKLFDRRVKIRSGGNSSAQSSTFRVTQRWHEA